MPRVLAIRDAVDAAVLLQGDDIADGLLLDGHERFGGLALVCDGVAVLDQLFWPEQRANVFSTKGRVAGRRHCGGGAEHKFGTRGAIWVSKDGQQWLNRFTLFKKTKVGYASRLVLNETRVKRGFPADVILGMADVLMLGQGWSLRLISSPATGFGSSRKMRAARRWDPGMPR
jgi:hypothetical protein